MKRIQDLKIIDQIRLVPNVLSQEECQLLINYFEKNQQDAATESSGKIYENREPGFYREEDNFAALLLNTDSEALRICLKGIKVCLINYLMFQKINFSKSLIPFFWCHTNNIRLLRYREGEEIKDHLDMNDQNRMSCSINLNDNYEGGAFSFFHGKHKINLKQGQGMVFPAETIWVHGVEKITKGTRYSINCFLQRQGMFQCI